MYTATQKEIIWHATQKIRELFKKFPVGGHGAPHTARVVGYAVFIARAEKANVFLSHLAALLHDIGRAEEFFGKKKEKGHHHELSYKLCQKWFREDKVLNKLTRAEKLELLYDVRYHYNNMARKYRTASVLRDADKLDAFGKEGIKRGIEFWGKDSEMMGLGWRLVMETSLWFETATAKKIFKERKLDRPVLGYYKKYLKSKIKAVEL